MKRHKYGWIGYYVASLFVPPLTLPLSVCLYGIAGLSILPSSVGFSPVAGLFVLGR